MILFSMENNYHAVNKKYVELLFIKSFSICYENIQ